MVQIHFAQWNTPLKNEHNHSHSEFNESVLKRDVDEHNMSKTQLGRLERINMIANHD